MDQVDGFTKKERKNALAKAQRDFWNRYERAKVCGTGAAPDGDTVHKIYERVQQKYIKDVAVLA